MYSVLIQNQKTIQNFHEYYPLFLDMFEKNQMGVCRWIESGRTVDTALPGLRELVDEKKEWRAVIVRIVEFDEHDMQEHAFLPDNPYDFVENSSSNKLTESNVPIIRLTQMLGEVPFPMQTFREEVRTEPAKAPRRVYVPNGIDPEEKEMYDSLVAKYEFDGHRPNDIILMTLACKTRENDRKNASNAWTFEENEANANFTRRNWYSPNCRFIQYRYTKEGQTRKEADFFNFWNCVMLLAADYIDPSSLQAYRLYSTRIDFNKEALGETFQNKYDELRSARNFVVDEIRRDVELRMNDKHPKPLFQASISSDVDIPKDTNVSVDTSDFALCPGSTGIELNSWKGKKGVAEDSLEYIFRRQDRVLDESANRMRSLSEVPDVMVAPIDKYEKIEMKAELDNLFDEILKTQNTLSDVRNVNNEKLNTLSEDVEKTIKERLTESAAIETAVILGGVIMASILPAFLISRARPKYFWLGILEVVIFCAVEIGLCVWGVLEAQKRKLINKVYKYNDAMEENLSLLTQDMSFFSKFVSNIVSFSRGSSFLNKLSHKKFKVETEVEFLQLHMNEIDRMLIKVDKWSKAFFIPVKVAENIGGEKIVNVEVPPRHNRLYTFGFNEEYMIPLNYTGDMIPSHFDFIDRLIIEREELFKDEGRDN